MQEMSRQGSFVLCQAAYTRKVRIWLTLACSSAIHVSRRKVSREEGNKLFHIGLQRKIRVRVSYRWYFRWQRDARSISTANRSCYQHQYQIRSQVLRREKHVLVQKLLIAIGQMVKF